MFELTYRCNFSCRYCYIPPKYKSKPELKTKEIFSIFEQLRGAGCFYLGLTGGEPFMRRDIMDILLFAKRCGLQVIIYTNGSLIDDKIAAELGRLSLNKVDITIPAMSKGAFEQICGVAGGQARVFSAIKLLRKNKVNLGFKSCVLKKNQDEIRDIQRFAVSLGVFHRLDNTLSRRLDGSAQPYKYRGELKSRGSRKIIKPENNPEMSDSSGAETADLFKCGVGESQAAITPQGELKLCLMIDEPRFSITKDSLAGAWNKLKGFVRSIKPDKNYRCNTCGLKAYCKWCPAKSWLYKKDFTSCDPESKFWAAKRQVDILSQKGRNISGI